MKNTVDYHLTTLLLQAHLILLGFTLLGFTDVAFLKNIFLIYLFLERGREGEREGEKHQCVVVFQAPATGDLAHNPGICPDWELNQRPFGSASGAQSTEPHQPGPDVAFLTN